MTPVYNPEKPQTTTPPSTDAGVKLTHYGYPGDSTPDSNSAAGIGDRDNRLVGGYSAALTQSERYARFGVTGKSTGKEFTFGGRTFRDNDTAPEPDRRVDVYDPTSTAIDKGGGGRPVGLPPNLRIATPEQLAGFKRYQANGGDTTLFSPNDMLAFRLAEDPGYLFKPENWPIFRDMVVKPTDEAQGGFIQQAGNAITSLPGAAKSAFEGLQAWGKNFDMSAIDGMKTWYNKLTGQKDDPALTQSLAQEQASTVAGAAQGVADAANMLDGVGATLKTLPDSIVRPFVKDPAQLQSLDDRRAQILQDHMRNQWQLAQGVQSVQGAVASGYKAIGMADFGNALEKATPDPAVVQGQALISNPLNYVPGAVGELVGKGFGVASKAVEAVEAIKPTFVEQAASQASDASQAITKDTIYKAGTSVPVGGLPKPTNLPEGVPPTAPSLISRTLSQLAPEAKQATTDAQTATNDAGSAFQNVAQELNSGGGINGWLGRNMQAMGQGTQNIAKGLAMVTDLPTKVATKLLGGDEFLGNVLGTELLDIGMGQSSEHAGLGSATGWGDALAMRLAPGPLNDVGTALKLAGKELTYGESTLPYFRRLYYQMETAGPDGRKLMGSSFVKALDNSFMYQAIPAAKGAITGALTGGVIGAASQPQSPTQGAIQGGAQGLITGMVGGGLGQLMKYRTPQEIEALSMGDWRRYREVISSSERTNFDKLSGNDQLALSQFAQQFPGLKVNYQRLGPGAAGFHTIEGGRSVIGVNLDQPGSALQGTIAHELAHGMASSGQLPEIYEALLGSPASGKPGSYTKMDLAGQPVVDPNTGYYQGNQEFQNLKNQYITKLNRSGIKTDRLDDLSIAREIYAEHGANYLLSGRQMMDAQSVYNPRLYASENSIKQVMMKHGAAFDGKGNVIGSGLFNNLQQNPALSNLVGRYVQQKYKSRLVGGEDMPDRMFDARNPEHWKTNTAETWLDNAPEIMRDAKGNVMKDKNGTPFLRPKREVDSYSAQMSNDIHSWVNGLSEDKRNELGFHPVAGTKDTWFGRYLPDDLLNSLASKNQYNFNQVGALRDLSKMLADRNQDGKEVNFFYHKATTNGKYGQFSGASYNAVPYGFEITKNANVNVKAVNFGRLGDNYLNLRDRTLNYNGQPTKLRSIWETPGDFMQDAHSMFLDHQQGKSGASTIGVQKRDIIHGLLKLGTDQNEVNPFASSVPNTAKHVISSFRIDRMNRLTPTDTVRPFSGEAQYSQFLKRNYRP